MNEKTDIVEGVKILTEETSGKGMKWTRESDSHFSFMKPTHGRIDLHKKNASPLQYELTAKEMGERGKIKFKAVTTDGTEVQKELHALWGAVLSTSESDGLSFVRGFAK